MPVTESDLRCVSGRLVGAVLDRSHAKVRDWVIKGILPPTVNKGKYDLIACAHAYINYIKYHKNREIEEDSRQSVLREKFKSLQLENRRRAGEVVEVEEVEEAFMRTMSLIAMRLEAIPGRLANELAAIRDPAMIRQRLRHEISDTRTSAEAGLKDFVNRVKGRGHYQEPSSESARRVGRSKARPARRVARARSVEK